MRPVACLHLTLALVLAASGGAAQQAGGASEVFVGVGLWGAAAPWNSAVGEWNNRAGIAPTLWTSSGPGSRWAGHTGNVWTATTDVDNRSILIYSLSPFVPNPSSYNILRWDPVTDAIASTVYSGPVTGTPQNITNMTVDSDGDLVAYDSVLASIVSLPQGASTWSQKRVNGGGVNGGLGGFEWDRLNGGFVHATAREPALSHALLRTSYDLGVTRTLAFASAANIAAFGGGWLENGTWISSSNGGPAYVTVTPGNPGSFQPGPTRGRVYFDVTPEKFAAPGRGYYAGFFSNLATQGVEYVDATTTPHTVVRTSGAWPAAVRGPIMETHPCFERDLVTVRTGDATWDIRLQLDPTGATGYQGKSFVIAASLASAVPATKLPSGRQLFLFPDVLTVATAQGSLPPFITGNVGFLGAANRPAVTPRIDLRLLVPFKSIVNGTVVHFCGIVLDQGAPDGIAWVSDPWAFVVDIP